jgi:hypothetical protein
MESKSEFMRFFIVPNFGTKLRHRAAVWSSSILITSEFPTTILDAVSRISGSVFLRDEIEDIDYLITPFL